MKAFFRRARALVAGAAIVAAGPSMAAVVLEFVDAGQTTSSAQVTGFTAAPLTDIFGLLRSSSDVDLYLISIVNAGIFSATTVNAVGAFLDTQLFLFTASGAPVYSNDDDAGGASLHSTLPAGSSFGPVSAGLYILGISLSGNDPVNSVSQLLFDLSGLSTDVRGPASGLQPATLGGFFDSGFYPGDRGFYRIQLTGAGTAIPEPASALLASLAVGLCAAATYRRRRQPKTAPAA